MKPFFLLLFLFSFAISSSTAQSYIRDESYQDKDFLAFKLELVRILMQKDKKALDKIIAKDIQLFKYSKGTPEEFNQSYFDLNTYDHTNNSPFWEQALRLVSFGFRKAKFDETEKEKGYTKVFYAPSFNRDFNFHHSGDYETFSSKTLILGDRVNVRAEPSITAKVIAQLSHQVVAFKHPIEDAWQPEIRNKYDLEGDDKYWYEIKLDNGKVGYVIEDYVAAGHDLDFRIAKTSKGWKIIAYYLPGRC